MLGLVSEECVSTGDRDQRLVTAPGIKAVQTSQPPTLTPLSRTQGVVMVCAVAVCRAQVTVTTLLHSDMWPTKRSYLVGGGVGGGQ